MAWALILAASFVLSICSVPANTWYAGISGASTNGTKANPWSIELAVGQIPNPLLQPGDTVIFLNGGPYICRETNTANGVGQVLEFRVSGTPTEKITFRAETLWGFSFDGGLLLPATVSNLVVRDLHVFYSGSIIRVRTNQFTHPPGINELGEGNAILHNLIENTGHPGIGSWKTTRGKYIAGNIIRFTGFDDYTGANNGANRGSGMYLQNADNSAEALIAGNISYFNYTTGMKAYGNTDIWKFNFKNQICAENAEAGIFYHLDNYGSTNLTVQDNFLWQNGTGIRIGYPLGNGGHSNALVTGNYIVDTGLSSYPFYIADGWSRCTLTNNIGVSLLNRYIWHLEIPTETNGDMTSHTIDFNHYFALDSGGVGIGQFGVKGQFYGFPEWRKLIRGETNSSFTYGFPKNVFVHAFNPTVDSNIVHVAVVNWPTNPTVAVNMSAYYRPGDHLRVFDAQELPLAYTNLAFSGSSIVLDLSRTNIAPMLGNFSQRATRWIGFDPRFRAFVIQKVGTRPNPPSDLHVFSGQN